MEQESVSAVIYEICTFFSSGDARRMYTLLCLSLEVFLSRCLETFGVWHVLIGREVMSMGTRKACDLGP